MIPALIILTLCNLALWWRQHRRAQAEYAALWQAVAEQAINHNALATATADEFRATSSRIDELDPAHAVNVTSPRAGCNCVNCRKRRQLETN